MEVTPGGQRSLRRWLSSDTRAAAWFRTSLVVLVLVVAWEVTARAVDSRLVLVPLPEIFGALKTEIQRGALSTNMATTLKELAVALPISIVLGVVLGVMLAANRHLREATEPVLTALNSVPLVAIAPLFIAWLGLGLTSKVVIIILVSVFSIIINTQVGIAATDPDYLEAARSFNASRLHIFRTVTFPFALPFMIGGIRVALSRALVGVIVAEFFGSASGMGYAILGAGQTLNTARLLVYVLILAVMGMVGSVALEKLERRVTRWR